MQMYIPKSKKPNKLASEAIWKSDNVHAIKKTIQIILVQRKIFLNCFLPTWFSYGNNS